MPDFALPQVTTQTIDTPDGPRIQTFNPRTGAKMADLGAGKPDNVTPEQGGRISGLLQAQDIAKQLRGKFLNEDGSVNRTTVLTSFGNVPMSEGRTARQDFEMALDAVIRARSGSGLNNSEMPAVREQLMPTPLDDDAGVKNKLNRLEQFVNGSLDIISLPPRIKALIDKREGSSPSGASKTIDYKDLPP
jgi:hypothetical protein